MWSVSQNSPDYYYFKLFPKFALIAYYKQQTNRTISPKSSRDYKFLLRSNKNFENILLILKFYENCSNWF